MGWDGMGGPDVTKRSALLNSAAVDSRADSARNMKEGSEALLGSAVPALMASEAMDRIVEA